MRRTRRRFRGTWFPNIGTIPAGGGLGQSGIQLQVSAAADSRDSTVGVVPIIEDLPIERLNAGTGPDFRGLNTLVGNEYSLRRIVGKCFATLTPTFPEDTETVSQAVKVTAGFFIARASDQEEGLGIVPIGGPNTYTTSYDPDGLNTIREPWIWRRAWILGASYPGGSVPTAAATASYNWPHNNVAYGSVADGPHIDAKTRRRVSSDDRLWFAVSARNYPLSSTVFDIERVVHIHLDYRVFGAMRRARQSGNF